MRKGRSMWTVIILLTTIPKSFKSNNIFGRPILIFNTFVVNTVNILVKQKLRMLAVISTEPAVSLKPCPRHLDH